MNQKIAMVEKGHPRLSVRAQCELLELSRSSLYYQPAEVSTEQLSLMRRIDEMYTAHPHLGSRGMRDHLRLEGWTVNRKRVQRLMRLMGLESVAPRPGTSAPHSNHPIYPYLLRGVKLERAGQVWSTDITYIPLGRSYLYLVAVIDWYSRYVLSWELSNSLELDFCLNALGQALEGATPEIFNSDQGSQFTSPRFTQVLKDHDIRISMDGKGRALDNIWVERLWRSLKYEEVYLNEYTDGRHCFEHLSRYFDYYNHARPHSSLGGKTPSMVHFDRPFESSALYINQPFLV